MRCRAKAKLLILNVNTELLVAELSRRLPEHEFLVPGAHQSVVSIESPHPDIGHLLVIDDGDEFTVHIGDMTHCHFELDDEVEPIEAAHQKVVDEVVDLVEGVLADRIEFFGGGTYGGSRPRSTKPRSWLSRLVLGTTTYVWSGPVKHDG